MDKNLKSQLDKAIKALEKANVDYSAAQEAFNSAEDEKTKEKAEKSLIKAKENLEAKEAEANEAQEAFNNAETNSGKIKGNRDSSYEFDEKEAGMFHIRHSRMETLASGSTVEDPGSVRIQKYGIRFIEDQKINKEKGEPSIWDMGETVKILHDPTK